MSKRKEKKRGAKVSIEDLASLYAGVYGMFEGVDRRTLMDHFRGRKIDSRILNRQAILLDEIVQMIDSNLDEPSNLSTILQPIAIKKDNVLKILEKINTRV